ncbi:MAG: TIGR02281 family clan AA aspartic protease [Sphingomonadales bacterium]|jgi:aspartyl protease family protein|nr:TIGR02281 family clan AA aspartic protease [Sphingomonadales bacterium]
MYKLVAFVFVGAITMAVLVGLNPPSLDTPVANETAPVEAAKAAPAETKSAALAGNGFASATLVRAADGHFYADAMVNGAPVRFMVDTGATSVALTKSDAQTIGLQFNDAEFTATGEGAGGAFKLKPITLDRVAVGAVEATGISAVIGDDSLKQSLLGQSFLSRVGTVTIEGDRMELR